MQTRFRIDDDDAMSDMVDKAMCACDLAMWMLHNLKPLTSDIDGTNRIEPNQVRS